MAENLLRVKFLVDARQLQQSLDSTSNKLKELGSSLTDVGGKLTKSLTAPLGIAAGIALKSAANFEKLKTQLTVLTGSAEAGSKAFERLVEFSAKTPFQLDELVRANNTLMGFGVSAEDAFKYLQMIGDVAAVSGGSVQGITVAFGQAAAAGRLMGQDLLQFINNGVGLSDMLAESMGVAKEEIKEMVSEGQVTFPVLVKAFQDATGEGGKFNGGMETLSQTINGVYSTLKDNLNIAFAELGNEIFKAFDLKANAEKFIKFINKLKESFVALEPQTKKTILVIAGITAAIGPVLLTIGALSKGLATVLTVMSTGVGVITKIAAAFRILTIAIMANPFTALVTAMVAVTAGFIEMLHQINPVVTRIQTFFNFLRSGGNILAFNQYQLESYAKNLKENKKSQDEVNTSVEAGKKAAEDYANTLTTLINNSVKTGETTEVVRNKIEKLQSSIKPVDAKEFITRGPEFKDITNDLLTTFKNISQKSKEISTQISVDFGRIGGSLAATLGEALITGENVMGAIGAAILNTLGDILMEMGAAAVAASNLMVTFAIPGIGALAGFAAIAIGAAVKAMATKVQNQGVAKFANGGIVSGPTLGLMGEYAGARSNPEVIAPLDKLKAMMGGGSQNVTVGGEFRIQGQDLVVALQRAERNRSRII